MDLKREWRPLLWIVAVFLALYFLPLGVARFDTAVGEALALAKWYAREHVLLCLVPAFFIAGAIAVFVSKAAVMRYLGPAANKVLAYSVASVSGTILAVCSCTVLPLFAGIYRMGAGLGPAAAFLYSGPAINVLAIILTARVLGFELGLARALGAILFSVIIGLAMHFLFLHEEREKAASAMALPTEQPVRPLWQTVLYFVAMIAVLVFANWARPQNGAGLWHAIYAMKWWIAGFALVALLLMLWRWYTRRELAEWLESSWGFAKQMLPLLFAGVLIAGLLLGRPGEEGLIPSSWVAAALGGNGLWPTLLASVAGALMYFATLTEVPILEGLIGNGMGQGPALALLLAGPALSLPNMLVIHSVIGLKKTLAFVLLVVVMATISGLIFGALVG